MNTSKNHVDGESSQSEEEGEVEDDDRKGECELKKQRTEAQAACFENVTQPDL